MKFKLFKGDGVIIGYANTIQEAMSRCEKQNGWYFEKEGRLTKEERIHKVVYLCINKQLEKYDLEYDAVIKGAKYEYFNKDCVEIKSYLWGLIKIKKFSTKKIPWYQHYTFKSKQEFNEWKEFCINLFRKELKMTKIQAEKKFAWFNLCYGLKQDYEVKI